MSGSTRDADNSFHAGWSPSGLPSYHDSDGSHRMTEADIEATIDGFVQAARRCHAAGFDGVEVWAAYHSMLDQFWTPWSNRRDDRWGGSLENRTRMSREVMNRIRRECGDDFIIGLSINDEPDVEVALQREALAEIIDLHDRDNLMDYVTCGTGSYFDFYKIMPTFLYPEKLGADLAGGDQVDGSSCAGDRRKSYPDAGKRRERAQRRPRRPCLHRARPDRRPASGQQGCGRTARGHPRLSLLQSDVLGTAFSRLLDQLRHQPLRRTRMGVGRRSFHAGRAAQKRFGRRRRAGRARSGARGGRARTSGNAGRSFGSAWRAIPAGRHCNRGEPRSWT